MGEETPTLPVKPILESSFLLKAFGAFLFFLLLAVGYFYLTGGFPLGPQAVDVAELKVGFAVPFAGFFPEAEEETITDYTNSHIFEGLVFFDKDFRLKPLLAESWENPDNLTWRIHLRKGVKFHDGTAFKAEDVLYSWAQSNEKGWPISGLSWPSVEKIEIIDDYTIDLKTKEPDPTLLNKLILGFVVSKSYSEENGFSTPNGTGPYRYVSWDLDTQTLVLEANENYYLKVPRVKKAIVRFYEDGVAALAAFQKGEVNFASIDPTVEELAGLESTVGVEVSQTPGPGGYYVYLDYLDRKSPYASPPTNPFRDPKVRQAIYQAINIDEVMAATPERFPVPSTQVMPSRIFGYNPQIQRLPYDPDRARELLAEAGYPDGFSFTLEAPFPQKEFLEVVAENLRAVGLEVDFQVATDPGATFARWSAKDATSFGLSWNTDTGETLDFLVNMCHTPTQDGKYGGVLGTFSNEELDGLIEQSAVELDPAKRKGLLQQAMKVAMDNFCVIPLFTAQENFAFRDDLDWSPRADARIRIDEISGKPTP